MLWTVRREDRAYGYVSYDSDLVGADWVAGRIDAYLALLADLAAGAPAPEPS